MAFWGDEFIFDGVSCAQYGLMVYTFDGNGQEDVTFPSGELVEDRIPGRYDSLTYGLVHNQPLEYTLVFGANVDSLDAVEGIDRYEVEAISAWLTGHSQRKQLMIVQEDMEPFYYRCTISELRLITYGSIPWAFSCKVSCDSPFAYTLPQETVYTVNGTKNVSLFNRSSRNGYYEPQLELALTGGDFSIVNLSDGGREFAFSGLPESVRHITIDNKNQIVTTDSDMNAYPYFNMHFLRLVRGDNQLQITGNGTVKFTCEFPVSIGG